MKILLLAYALLQLSPAYGDTVKLNNHRYVWSGELTLAGLNKFSEQLASDPGISELELRDSVGAGSNAGKILSVIEPLMTQRNLKTFARGQCASTCAIVFLLGKERTLLQSLSKTPTHLMLHAARSAETGEINYGMTDRFLKQVTTASQGKLPLNLLEQIYQVKNASGGLFITREPQATETASASVFLCTGTESILKKPCQAYVEYTPEKLGIKIE